MNVQKDLGRVRDFDELRRCAEEALRGRGTSDANKLASQGVLSLIHELEVHQIELEMQNDELRRVQEALEAERDRYVDLYDFAPIGYLTVSDNGQILEANLTAARLLGMERGVLLGQSLSCFVATEGQDVYYQHRKAMLAANQPQTCEVTMVKRGGTPFDARIQSVGIPDKEGTVSKWRTVIGDVTERKRAEQALRVRDRAMAAAANGIIITDWNQSDNPIIYGNPAFENISGYTLDEVLGHNARFLQGDDCEQEGLKEVRTAIGQGHECQVVVRNYRKDGTLFWNELTISPVRDKKGQVAHFVGIQNDITERKRAEEALQHERDFAESLIETAQAIVLVLDPEGRIVRFNPFMEQFSGYRLAEVQGENWFTTFLPKRDRSRMKAVFSRAVSGIQTRGHISHLVTHDKQERDISWSDKTLKDADGNTVGLLSIGHDVTESRRAAAALRDHEQQLRLILASTAEGIFGMDLDSKCTFANRSCIELLGYEEEKDLLGQDMHALIHHTRSDGTPHPKEECLMYQACRQNKVVYLDDEVLWRADGGSFSAEGRSNPMLRNGKVVGTVVSFTDITERKEKEAQLLQAQKMKVVGQLTGGIAHDFSNLLTVILGNLGLLADEIASDANMSIGELIDDAFSAARDGAELIQRLLTFSRKQSLQVKRVDINQLFSNIKRLLQRTLREDIELRINRAMDIPPVLVDPGQFENALLNLVINARDAMPGGGTLIIETTRKCIRPDEAAANPEVSPGNYVMIAVSDSGIGMSPKDAARAIEPFFTTKGRGGGSGLGLSMVYGFAKQSGGGLLLRSALGEGTTVSLLVPEAALAIEKEQAEPVLVNIPGGSETILLVEDELLVRKLTKRSLLGMGYQVLEAEGAAEAMKALEAGATVDLLFSDIVMPGDMNGRKLARWVLQRRRGLKVLLTTGFSEEEVGECSVSEGGLHLLKKPYTKEELARAVRAVLDAEQQLKVYG